MTTQFKLKKGYSFKKLKKSARGPDNGWFDNAISNINLTFKGNDSEPYLNRSR